MNNKFIAYCGLNCKECEAYIATLNNDNELRKKVAKKWSELNDITITPKEINCLGCKCESVKTPFCDHLCPIRKCALSKSVFNCGKCSNINSCDKIKMIISNNKKALNNLKK